MKMNDKSQVKTKQTQNLAYKGEVTIKFVKDKSKIKVVKKHNYGTNYLFELLARCLAGQNVKSQMPQFVDVYYNSASILNYRPKITGASPNVNDKGTMWVTTFTAFVPSTAIASSKDRFNEVRLYASPNGNDLLAVLNLDEDKEIPDAYSIMIEWAMTVGNYTSND